MTFTPSVKKNATKSAVYLKSNEKGKGKVIVKDKSKK